MKFILLTILFLSPSAFAKSKELTNDHICRATISTIFDQKPEEVTVFRTQSNVIYLKFPQGEKNKVTRFKCIVQGEEIIWATEMGSYRNTGIDSNISFKEKDNVLTVKEAHKNGSVFTKTFDIQKLMAE